MSADKPHDRRAFFRKGLSELLKKVSEKLEPLNQAIDDLERLGAPLERVKADPLRLPLRPPGALPEQQFRQTCSRCGDCVRACPVEAIKLDVTGRRGGGAPYIDADQQACALCSGLHCMDACPSGALIPTPLNLIRMGTAVWRRHTCRLTDDTACTTCEDACPVGRLALRIFDGEVRIDPKHCTGCGLCQNVCPTAPKSVVVIPVAARG